MPTILELKAIYSDLDTQLNTMVGGKDIFDDAWSPADLVVDNVTDEIEKMTIYTNKAQERKAIEVKLTQAESVRKQVAEGLKAAPLDSEFSFPEITKQNASDIKTSEDLRGAIKGLAQAYKDGHKTSELKFDSNFLKAVVVASGAQGRQLNQQIIVPTFPTMDLLTLADWHAIESNIYTRYEMASGTAAGQRAEGAAVVDLNPTVPQRNFTLQNTAGYVSTARESLEDLGQLEMAVKELINRELRKTAASQAAIGTGTSNWSGLATQITKTAAVGTDTKILGSLRTYLLAAVANGYPYTHLLADATTIGKFIESLDKRNFSQYDRERFPFGYYLSCVAVPVTQFAANTAVLVAQDHLMIVHKGDIEIMMSEDVHFLTNAIAIRGTLRANIVYMYPAAEGQMLTTTEKFIVE